ncbi:MAG: VOC family protein [Rhodopila sp.]|jgi:catechol 2,3-dioxygenase-like lactoylglutathione lyase family enzyme
MKILRPALLLAAAGLFLIATKPRRSKLQAQRILRFSRVVADLDRAEAFYRDALGFRTILRGRCDPLPFAPQDAQEIVIRLGHETIALVRFATPGRPCPPDSRSNDLWFQHLAIVVTDMDAAHAHLLRHQGWQPITDGGPQLLPPSNGAVRAFKFRDPDGHPLELLWFPPGQGRGIWQARPADTLFLGVDHSALSTRSTPRSQTFYRTLGLHVSDRSLNHGPAQASLDGLPGATVRVTGLRPASDSGPGIELLGYHPPGRAAATPSPNDLVTDWITLLVSPPSGDVVRMTRDPDGHLLLLVDHGAAATGLPA